MEFNPEVFAQVTMLYVTMDVGTSQCLHNMTQMALVNLFCILTYAVRCMLQHVAFAKSTFHHDLSSRFQGQPRHKHIAVSLHFPCLTASAAEGQRQQDGSFHRQWCAVNHHVSKVC